MAKFELGDRFGDLLKDVSNSDTTLEKIDINLLDSDERNFYAVFNFYAIIRIFFYGIF